MKNVTNEALEILRDHVTLKVAFCRSQASFFESWGKVYASNKEAMDAYTMAADNLRFIADQLEDSLRITKSVEEEIK